MISYPAAAFLTQVMSQGKHSWQDDVSKEVETKIYKGKKKKEKFAHGKHKDLSCDKKEKIKQW